MDVDLLIQSVLAMLVITAPPDPAKLIFFNSVVAQEGLSPAPAAAKVGFIVLIVLGGAALVGAQIAKAMGINLDAFSVVGGVIVAGMGFEMLYDGLPSRAQGQESVKTGPDETSGLVMPLAIPLIAGPGAIATVVTMSTADNGAGLLPALISVAAVALATYFSLRYFGDLLAQASPSKTALLTRIGGLLLATIGTQMLLGGLKRFFLE